MHCNRQASYSIFNDTAPQTARRHNGASKEQEMPFFFSCTIAQPVSQMRGIITDNCPDTSHPPRSLFAPSNSAFDFRPSRSANHARRRALIRIKVRSVRREKPSSSRRRCCSKRLSLSRLQSQSRFRSLPL